MCIGESEEEEGEEFVLDTKLLEPTGVSVVDVLVTLGRIHRPVSSSNLHSESILSRL